MQAPFTAAKSEFDPAVKTGCNLLCYEAVPPGLVQGDQLLVLVTDLAALVTSIFHYPRGYRWPVVEL